MKSGVNMKATQLIAITALVAGSGLALHMVQAQVPGIRRAPIFRRTI